MASKAAERTLKSLSRQQSRMTCECNSLNPRIPSIRRFSSSPAPRVDSEPTYSPLPTESSQRWSETPERMRAPYRIRLRDTTKPWQCNTDPARLDRFYKNLLGPGGENVLSEEVKWLAVTHKSFEQGARGFNDRLAFFGRRILNLQTNLVLLNSPTASSSQRLGQPDPPTDREPYSHPALDGLENLSNIPIAEVLTKSRLARFAVDMEMPGILRWLPRMPNRLEASGIDVVMATTVYAIIGAIALQRGGAVAGQFARERVLKPMGIQ